MRIQSLRIEEVCYNETVEFTLGRTGMTCCGSEFYIRWPTLIHNHLHHLEIAALHVNRLVTKMTRRTTTGSRIDMFATPSMQAYLFTTTLRGSCYDASSTSIVSMLFPLITCNTAQHPSHKSTLRIKAVSINGHVESAAFEIQSYLHPPIQGWKIHGWPFQTW